MQFVVFLNFNLIYEPIKSVLKWEVASAIINKNIQYYAAKIQDQDFDDRNIFALKNDWLLWYDIGKAFPYFNL